MRLWRGLGEVPADWKRSAVIVGTFDGVHRGHQRLLHQAREHADRLGLPLVAVTFDPPLGLVAGTLDPPVVLTGAEYRAGLLAQHGVDAVCVLEATPDLAALPSRDLAHRILVDGVPAAVALLAEEDDDGVVFDLAAVHALGKEHDFSVVGLAASSGPEAVTAAQVRSLVLAGDVAGAHTALGRPHRVEGVVVHGAARGRELLGFPTANLDCPPRSAVPADGVYAGWLLRLDTPPEGTEARWPAAVSVGTNPTFDGQVRTVEAYALDRDDLELYGLPMAVEFTHHIRPMLRFDSIDELIEAMQRDVDRCRELLAGR
ncbi:bifunctional riboflavin kinase/FMN adenylyltransferase [Thermobifida fusca]|uniref:bifunctional riboflavin kinase/FMN adenylyltransferase n=1 Tax=Thermobifida fusca TaxID=2021 RepID=UPI000D1BF4AE|nr:bifunctional riboflavin kinase/FMN adenylyltransferase [Thermobifida fusca]